MSSKDAKKVEEEEDEGEVLAEFEGGMGEGHEEDEDGELADEVFEEEDGDYYDGEGDDEDADKGLAPGAASAPPTSAVTAIGAEAESLNAGLEGRHEAETPGAGSGADAGDQTHGD